MSLISYGLTRNVEAVDEHGNQVLLCLAAVRHENGFEQIVAIREDLIRFAGEGIIDREVRRAARR